MLIFCGSSPSVYRYTYSCTDLYKPHTMYRGQLIYVSDVSVNKTPDLYLCNVQLPLSWLSEWMLSVAVIVCVPDCVVDQPLLLLSCLIYLCRVFIYSYLIKFPYQRNIQISKHLQTKILEIGILPVFWYETDSTADDFMMINLHLYVCVSVWWVTVVKCADWEQLSALVVLR